jgi:hypothetical protein
MTVWREACIGFQIDNIKIGGIEVWAQRWRPVKTEPLLLPHPTYPEQMHRYLVYEIGDSALPIRFAASELSNGVWGFYVPVESSN